MMKIQDYLRLLDRIVTRGIKRENKYHLNQLKAWHDIDGYTCYIEFKDLTISLYFHNRSSYEFNNKNTVREFEFVAHRLLADT